MARNTIADQLASAQIALDNAIADPAITAALAAYGYSTERLQQGIALRESVRTMQQQQKNEYGGLVAANDTLATAQRQAHDNYMNHVNVARVALKGDQGALEKLGLREERSDQLASWLWQAQQFYANSLANTPITDKLAPFGLTTAVLTAGQTQMNTVSAAASARQQQYGAAKDATRERNEKLAALESWMSDFRRVARVALKHQPGSLEKLGLKSRRTTRQTATPTSEPVPGGTTV